MKTVQKKQTDPLVQQLLDARLHDPFEVLGPQRTTDGWLLRVFRPRSERVELRLGQTWVPLVAVGTSGIFEWRGSTALPADYRLKIHEYGSEREIHDPYAFAPILSDLDLHLFNEGRLHQAYRMLGAHPAMRAGISGTQFTVWAPNAERVSVVGDINHWDGRVHQMRVSGGSGIWQLFIPGVESGTLYKYEIRNRQHGGLLVKSDPYGQEFELRPGTANRVPQAARYTWGDQEWLARRAKQDWLHKPLSIYEVHLGSWRRNAQGGYKTYAELADELVSYVADMGFTHLELVPISEHPLDESWGYQTTGYFAATARYGGADALRALIDACHQANVGVILDWVPAHFPRDGFALAHFDGTALYEHEDPRLGQHQDWGTLIFNYGRNEVKSFLLSSAHYWLEEFHIDGLRVDAVASMLYLDYSRSAGEWLPNRFGGRENLEAIAFLKELNIMVHDVFPGALTFAEESTAWPMVSRPVHLGGLGFSMKWNMGWMNDTLRYIGNDPVHRRYHHNELTFGQIYAYTENFVLPFSHDEVVHGKRSLLDKMPGDAWQKFANLRLLLAYQMTYPGKKLNFMGNEWGHGSEWRATDALDWWLLEIDFHRGIQTLMRDLNKLYRDEVALHDLEFEPNGFRWIDCHDADQSVLSYIRKARDSQLVVVILNFTPVPRHHYRVGMPLAGGYREIFNSDSHYYGGSNIGNRELATEPKPWAGFQDSVAIEIPPLGVVVLKPTHG